MTPTIERLEQSLRELKLARDAEEERGTRYAIADLMQRTCTVRNKLELAEFNRRLGLPTGGRKPLHDPLNDAREAFNERADARHGVGEPADAQVAEVGREFRSKMGHIA